MLNPTRIVFEGNERVAQVDLINNGTETTTYRIGLVNRRMSESGEFSTVDKPLPGEQFADPLLRFSPRQVVLEPGAMQVVRISLRKPADLPAGEYRSHLLFERVPDTDARTSIESQAKPGDKEIGIRLVALVGASIPVIVRNGDTKAEVKLSDLSFAPPASGNPAILSLTMLRAGNRSTYGDITVTFTPQSGGQPMVVAKVGGVAIYVPNPARKVRLALQPEKGVTLARGTLSVTYATRAEEGGAPMAQASLTLP